MRTVMEETVVNELLDGGSTPPSSTNFHKEGPAEGGRNPCEARRRLRTEFAF